jgi:hypothetical protein
VDRVIAITLPAGRLLADGPSRVVSFSEPIRRGAAAQMDWRGLAFALLALVACVLMSFWLSRVARFYFERRRHSPAQLFVELCRAHGLSRAERRMLDRLAAAHGLKHAAEIFLDESRFDLKDETFTAQRHAVLALRRRLFAQPQGQL